MNVELRLTGDDDAYVIKNLWPLYAHEVTEFGTCLPNVHGLIHADDGVATLAAQGETLSAWWQRPEALFPYLVLADGRPAGFNLIATRPYLPEGIDIDFVVREFFVLHAFRGKGVAERAALEGFDRHRGRWEVVTYPTHARAIAFWRRVTSGYAPNGRVEGEIDHPWGRKVAFRFDNGRA